MATNPSSEPMRAIILSFPLNFRKITNKLREDVEAINFVTPIQAFGSNMRRVSSSTTCIKLYLPNLSENGFSTTFYVSGNMSEERLIRSINVYGLAASLHKFSFVHYIANSHLMVCISLEDSMESKDYTETIRLLNNLHNFINLPA